eukprot:487250_1
MLAIFNIVLVISTITAQIINHNSTKEEICITGSILTDINGRYKYFSQDSNSNEAIYFSANTSQYIYPWIYSNTSKHYLISNGFTQNISRSLCKMPSNEQNFSLENCFDGWISNTSGEWISDVELRLVPCNVICINNCWQGRLNGEYKWMHFNRTRNSSIYYCEQCGFYLFGWIYSNPPYNWRIGRDYNNQFAETSCVLIEIYTSTYVFNLDDCIYGWDHSINGEWIDDEEMTAGNCADVPLIPTIPINYDFGDKMCVFGSITASLSGTYHFSNRQIYYNEQSEHYLFFKNSTHEGTVILILYHNETVAYCNMSDHCINGWMSYINDTWISDSAMGLIRTSVYYCEQCYMDGYNNIYLHGWIFNSWGAYYWRIGPEYTNDAAWSTCFLGKQREDYIFDVQDCILWTNFISNSWINDEDGIVETIIYPTLSPTENPTKDTDNPTNAPSFSPSAAPTQPSIHPTYDPIYN